MAVRGFSHPVQRVPGGGSDLPAEVTETVW